MQTPSWQEISTNYATEDEDGRRKSRAVVCDINKEMLKVGKQKADSMGIRAGTFLSVLPKLGGFRVTVTMYTNQVLGYPIRVKILWLQQHR